MEKFCPFFVICSLSLLIILTPFCEGQGIIPEAKTIQDNPGNMTGDAVEKDVLTDIMGRNKAKNDYQNYEYQREDYNLDYEPQYNGDSPSYPPYQSSYATNYEAQNYPAQPQYGYNAPAYSPPAPVYSPPAYQPYQGQQQPYYNPYYSYAPSGPDYSPAAPAYSYNQPQPVYGNDYYTGMAYNNPSYGGESSGLSPNKNYYIVEIPKEPSYGSNYKTCDEVCSQRAIGGSRKVSYKSPQYTNDVDSNCVCQCPAPKSYDGYCSGYNNNYGDMCNDFCQGKLATKPVDVTDYKIIYISGKCVYGNCVCDCRTTQNPMNHEAATYYKK